MVQHGSDIPADMGTTAQIQKYRNTYLSIIKGKKERSKYGY